MMQGKKDVPFWEAFQGDFRVYTIAALANGLFNGLATGLFGDKVKEDDFMSNLLLTAALSTIVSVPMFGGFAESVSYTHLDVYKRQTKRRAG